MERKLDTAAAFDRMFSLYGGQATVLLGAALVIFVPIAILSGILAASGELALVPVVLVVAVIGQALYTGTVVEAVADMRDGRRDFSAGQLLRAAVPLMFPLLGGGILYGLAVVLGFIALIVPGLIVLTWFSLFAPAIVVEKRRVLDSFSRSRGLVRGNGWRVFGVIVVTFIIQSVIQSIFQRIGVGASDSDVVAIVFSAIGQVITAPISALAVSVVYFDLRDLEGPLPA
jgi:hypothetical protein